MAIIILLNNFMHDFSAAGWLVCTAILWTMLKRIGNDPGEVIIETLKTILFLMRLSLGGIIVFGIVRAFAYKSYEWNTAAGDGQITLLIVKHVILTAVFVLGATYYFKAKKALKKDART